MAYKYETKNCRNCEHCVKTDNGLYCSHREGHPKVTSGGWCIDMQEKAKGNLNNDMMPVDTTVHISPEDIKWELKGDLISREALKKSIKSYADDQYAENEYLGEYAIMNIIDNAPTVEPFEPDYVGAERLKARQRGYAEGYHNGMEIGKTLNPKIKQGEWIIIKDERYGDNVKCPFCEKELAGTDLNFCCKCGAKLTGSEKMNGGAV